MRKILLSLMVAAAAMALTFASCQTPADVDPETVYGRRAIDLMAEGEAYERENNYTMALERYNKALELSPRPALYYRIGACYYQMAEYQKSYEYLNSAVRLAGDYPAAQYLLSRVRIQLAIAQRRGTPTPSATATAVVITTTPPVAATRTPVRTEVALATPQITIPIETPEPTPTPRPTRVIVETTPEPTPPPTPIPTPTPERIEASVTPFPTPAPTKTPTPRPTESVEPTPDVIVVPVTPPSSVERVGPSDPDSDIGEGSLPNIDPADLDKIFDGTSVTEISDEPTSETNRDYPLLGQWRFHWSKAQSFMERNLYEEAIEDLLICITLRPNHLDSRLMLADAYDKVGRGEKALRHYEYARVMAPRNPKPYFRTGNYYLRHALKGEGAVLYTDALRYYNLAVRVDPKYYEAYHNAAIVYMKLGDYENARIVFEKAIEIKPDYAKAHRNLGLLYEQYLKNTEAARRHYEAAIKYGVEDADVVREYLNALP